MPRQGISLQNNKDTREYII